MSMADRDGWIWYDGKMVPWRDATTHVLTHTLHYGMGVFEGVRCYKTADGPGDLPPARPHRPAVPLGADLRHEDPVHARTSSTEAQRACVRDNKLESCYLRPIAFYGSRRDGRRREVQSGARRDRRVAVGRVPRRRRARKGHPRQDVVVSRTIIRTSRCAARRPCRNYAVSILANQEATHDGYEEAMLLDPQGYVCQGSGENVFIVRDGKLHTPDLSGGALAGITRDTIITVRRASSASRCIERRITRDEFYVADEAFFTGTAAEVTPIREFDHRPIGDGGRGPITAKLQAMFFDAVNGRNPAHERVADAGVTMTDDATHGRRRRARRRTCRCSARIRRCRCGARIRACSSTSPTPAKRCAPIAARATASKAARKAGH